MGFRPSGRQCHYRTLCGRHVHWAALGESSPQSAGWCGWEQISHWDWQVGRPPCQHVSRLSLEKRKLWLWLITKTAGEVNTTSTSCVHADVNHTTVAKGEKTPWSQEAESLLPVPFPDKTSSQQTGEKAVGSGAIISERTIRIASEQKVLNC